MNESLLIHHREQLTKAQQQSGANDLSSCFFQGRPTTSHTPLRSSLQSSVYTPPVSRTSHGGGLASPLSYRSATPTATSPIATSPSLITSPHQAANYPAPQHHYPYTHQPLLGTRSQSSFPIPSRPLQTTSTASQQQSAYPVNLPASTNSNPPPPRFQRDVRWGSSSDASKATARPSQRVTTSHTPHGYVCHSAQEIACSPLVDRPHHQQLSSRDSSRPSSLLVIGAGSPLTAARRTLPVEFSNLGRSPTPATITHSNTDSYFTPTRVATPLLAQQGRSGGRLAGDTVPQNSTTPPPPSPIFFSSRLHSPRDSSVAGFLSARGHTTRTTTTTTTLPSPLGLIDSAAHQSSSIISGLSPPRNTQHPTSASAINHPIYHPPTAQRRHSVITTVLTPPSSFATTSQRRVTQDTTLRRGSAAPNTPPPPPPYSSGQQPSLFLPLNHSVPLSPQPKSSGAAITNPSHLLSISPDTTTTTTNTTQSPHHSSTASPLATQINKVTDNPNDNNRRLSIVKGDIPGGTLNVVPSYSPTNLLSPVSNPITPRGQSPDSPSTGASKPNGVVAAGDVGRQKRSPLFWPTGSHSDKRPSPPAAMPRVTVRRSAAPENTQPPNAVMPTATSSSSWKQSQQQDTAIAGLNGRSGRRSIQGGVGTSATPAPTSTNPYGYNEPPEMKSGVGGSGGGMSEKKADQVGGTSRRSSLNAPMDASRGPAEIHQVSRSPDYYKEYSHSSWNKPIGPPSARGSPRADDARSSGTGKSGSKTARAGGVADAYRGAVSATAWPPKSARGPGAWGGSPQSGRAASNYEDSNGDGGWSGTKYGSGPAGEDGQKTKGVLSKFLDSLKSSFGMANQHQGGKRDSAHSAQLAVSLGRAGTASQEATPSNSPTAQNTTAIPGHPHNTGGSSSYEDSDNLSGMASPCSTPEFPPTDSAAVNHRLRHQPTASLSENELDASYVTPKPLPSSGSPTSRLAAASEGQNLATPPRLINPKTAVHEIDHGGSRLQRRPSASTDALRGSKAPYTNNTATTSHPDSTATIPSPPRQIKPPMLDLSAIRSPMLEGTKEQYEGQQLKGGKGDRSAAQLKCSSQADHGSRRGDDKLLSPDASTVAPTTAASTAAPSTAGPTPREDFETPRLPAPASERGSPGESRKLFAQPAGPESARRPLEAASSASGSSDTIGKSVRFSWIVARALIKLKTQSAETFSLNGVSWGAWKMTKIPTLGASPTSCRVQEMYKVTIPAVPPHTKPLRAFVKSIPISVWRKQWEQQNKWGGEYVTDGENFVMEAAALAFLQQYGQNFAPRLLGVLELAAPAQKDAGSLKRTFRSKTAQSSRLDFTGRSSVSGSSGNEITHIVIVSELYGEDLLDFLERREKQQRPLTAEEKTMLQFECLCLLRRLHNLGLSHLDFTPENVLYGPKGLRLCDFAKATPLLTQNFRHIKTMGASGPFAFESCEPTVGKGAYMPPECWKVYWKLEDNRVQYPLDELWSLTRAADRAEYYFRVGEADVYMVGVLMFWIWSEGGIWKCSDAKQDDKYSHLVSSGLNFDLFRECRSWPSKLKDMLKSALRPEPWLRATLDELIRCPWFAGCVPLMADSSTERWTKLASHQLAGFRGPSRPVIPPTAPTPEE